MKNNERKSKHSQFVADGRHRALRGIEAEARAAVEKKYAATWNAAGYIQRWFLSRKIDREVAQRVAQRADQAPPDAQY